MTTTKKIIRSLLTLALVSSLGLAPKPAHAFAQEKSVAQPSSQTSADKAAAGKPLQAEGQASQPEQAVSAGGSPAKETREAEGDEQEENANLKHSASVQWLGKHLGLSVHGAHLLAMVLNFAIIAGVIFWAVRKFVPGMLRTRSESIQKALEEARTASQEAGKRLADIENRLRQMDAEIAKMQVSAEKEAEGEEARIQKAAEDELRKVVQAAEQEIAAAAKQVRRELSTHTADLALALARKQINVDLNTDQVLVRNFASKLATGPAAKPSPKNDGGKDDR